MRTKLDGPYSVPNCLCIICKHYRGSRNKVRVCTAFPNGIPLDIWNLETSHLTQYEGDRGIQFEESDVEQKYNISD